MSKSVKLTTPNQETLELPVLEASIGHDVVDIRALTKNTGLFSFDPGFVSTASCESKITYIDGDEGLLYYRGYPIEQLAEKSDYLEVCYLLIYGELPTRASGFLQPRSNLRTDIDKQCRRGCTWLRSRKTRSRG